MKRTDLLSAVAEAKRFIERAEHLIATWDEDRRRSSAFFATYPEREPYSPKAQGATRRASMDLTRTLSKLRGAK